METETTEFRRKSRLGGFRKGAGRKPIWNNEGRKSLHVPVTIFNQLVTIAHALDKGKNILVEEPEQTKRLRELLNTERNRMEAAAQAKGLSPEKMPTWKNVQKLLHELEEILNSG